MRNFEIEVRVAVSNNVFREVQWEFYSIARRDRIQYYTSLVGVGYILFLFLRPIVVLIPLALKFPPISITVQFSSC
jgi:hypothetical protein